MATIIPACSPLVDRTPAFLGITLSANIRIAPARRTFDGHVHHRAASPEAAAEARNAPCQGGFSGIESPLSGFMAARYAARFVVRVMRPLNAQAYGKRE
jgi:hypothetical protein